MLFKIVSLLLLVILTLYSWFVITLSFISESGSIEEGLGTVAIFGIPTFILWIFWLRSLFRG